MDKYNLKDLYDSSILTACIHDKNIVGFVMEMLRFCTYPESYILEANGELQDYNEDSLKDIAVFLQDGLDYNPKKIDLAQKIYQMSLDYLTEIDIWEKLEEAHLCFWYILVEDWNLQTIKVEKHPFNLFFLNFVFSYNLNHVEENSEVVISSDILKERWKKYVKDSLSNDQ